MDVRILQMDTVILAKKIIIHTIIHIVIWIAPLLSSKILLGKKIVLVAVKIAVNAQEYMSRTVRLAWRGII